MADTLYIRNLTFHCNLLPLRATLLLTFDAPKPGIYIDYYPTAWKVITFGEIAPYGTSVTYRHQPAVTKPALSGEVITGTTAWTDIYEDQITNLYSNGKDYTFSIPTKGPLGFIQVRNYTASAQGIGIGMNPNERYSKDPPTTLWYYPNVGVSSGLSTTFEPVLSAYVVLDFGLGLRENRILRIPTPTPPLRQFKLKELDKNTSWLFQFDIVTKNYTLVPDLPPISIPTPLIIDGTHNGEETPKELAKKIRLFLELADAYLHKHPHGNSLEI